MIKAPFWSPADASGFLLDWDGVIAETHLDFSPLRDKYFGGRRAMILEEASSLAPDAREAMMKDLVEIEMAGAERAVPVAGAFELIDWLKENGVPFCILSRNCMDVIRCGAKAIGLELPEMTWGRDNMAHVKPDPAALREAASALGAAPERCLYVGDFLYDLQGARRAGMRAVLVQHDGREWEDWADLCYAQMNDLVDELKSPRPHVPWEYREIFAKKGERWLDSVYQLSFELPGDPSPTADCWLLRAAAIGVGSFYVDPEKIFTPSDWKKHPSFDTAFMGKPWAEAVAALLRERFPMASVTTEAGSAMTAPKNSLDLMRFIERKKLF